MLKNIIYISQRTEMMRNSARPCARRWLLVAILSVFTLTIANPIVNQSVAGPLDLDWTQKNALPSQSNPSFTFVNCSAAGGGDCRHAYYGFNGVPVMFEQYFVDGVSYRHMIMGDPSGDFAQELIIQASPLQNTGGPPGTNSFKTSVTASGGIVAGGGPGSLAPVGCEVGCAKVIVSNEITDSGNGHDPLGIVVSRAGGNSDSVDTGIGTGYPTLTKIQMILNDGDEFSQTFLKDSFENKPRITETITTDDLTLFVDIDMRHVSYDTADVIIPMINTLTFNQESDSVANFDMATDAQDANVTAGQFVFVPGQGWKPGSLHSAGWDSGAGFDAGEYFSADGDGFNVYDPAIWRSFRDPVQNGGDVFTPSCAPNCVLPAWYLD